MKVTLIGHAAILVEADGVTILSDPWWRGPCFGAQWWPYPLPFLQALDGRKIDFIYLSHGHHDHFHPATLNTLGKETQILVSGATGLADSVRALGFKVTTVGDDEEHPLGGTATCRIMRTYGDDTLMVIGDGKETCVNLNDSLHSAPREVQDRFISRLRGLYPRIDYVFCGYGVASHFPNCYLVPGKDRELTAVKRQQYFNRQWARIIAELGPRHAFPFAADVVFFEQDLQWANEPVHNAERPTETYAKLYGRSAGQLHDIAPGFSIEDGVVLEDRRRGKVSIETAKDQCRDAVSRANSYGSATREAVAEVRTLLDSNIRTSREFLESYPGRYRFLIKFRNAAAAIEVVKNGRELKTAIIDHGGDGEGAGYDVVYTTRLAYLRQSLNTEFGHEILFVGSGGLFRYADLSKVRSNLHRELMVIMRRRAKPLAARRGGLRSVLGRIKRTVKALAGRRELDLYDLYQWTAFEK